MDLDNTIRQDNLVVLKEGVKTFQVGVNETKFEPNKYYRSIFLQNGNHKEVIINGELFINEQYDELFETAQTRVLRDFENLNIIVNGKVISRTAFGKLLDVHTYGRNSFKIAYISKGRALLYGFFPFFKGETKANTIKSAYQSVLDIIEGDVTCLDEHYVQFGNCGIPISANPSSRLKVRDTTNEIPFEL